MEREGSRAEAAPPTLVLATAIWQRPELTALTLALYRRTRQRLRPYLDLRPIAVGSEGQASRELAESAGFEYVEWPNAPLNKKWNAVIQAARKHDPLGVVIVGSDDWLPDEYFLHCLERLENGVQVFGLLDLFFVDLRTLRTLYFPPYQDARRGTTVGAGRCFSRAALQRLEWSPWSPDIVLDRSLDRHASARLAQAALPELGQTMARLGIVAVDVKSDTGLWSFDDLPANQVETPPAEELLEGAGDAMALGGAMAYRAGLPWRFGSRSKK